MPLLLAIVALLVPRIVILLLWIFSTWFNGVFSHFLIPFLGFLFLPYTLLWYTVVMKMFGGTWGFWQLVFLIIAIVLDIFPARRSWVR